MLAVLGFGPISVLTFLEVRSLGVELHIYVSVFIISHNGLFLMTLSLHDLVLFLHYFSKCNPNSYFDKLSIDRINFTMVFIHSMKNISMANQPRNGLHPLYEDHLHDISTTQRSSSTL